MTLLEDSVLNWFQYQFNGENVMDMNMISLVWMSWNWPMESHWGFNTKSCLDDKLWKHSALFNRHQIKIYTICDYNQRLCCSRCQVRRIVDDHLISLALVDRRGTSSSCWPPSLPLKSSRPKQRLKFNIQSTTNHFALPIPSSDSP